MLVRTLQQLHRLPVSVAIKLTIPAARWSFSARDQRFRMASTFPDLPIFRAIARHDPESTAIIHSTSARRFKYGELLKDVEDAKIKLYKQLKHTSPESIGGQRVAFLVENGYDYVGAITTGFPLLISVANDM